MADIEIAEVDELIQVLREGKRRLAFLVGAGTSKAAGIPLASELVAQWQEGYYRFKTGLDPKSGELEAWVATVEEWKPEEESEYASWFSRCHRSSEQRRRFIEQLVEDIEPTFGIIALAAMMAEEWVPLTLTTNFDDLLYDSLYLFLEKKPLLINHDALAPMFRFNTSRPQLIKLHGDYLYDNLKNLGDETVRLERNMARVFQEALKEYGLVVVGYGGNDTSIMQALADLPSNHLPYGMWWCTTSKAPESLPDPVQELLLGAGNRFLVQIENSESLLGQMYAALSLRKPQAPLLQRRTKERIELLKRARSELEVQMPGDVRSALAHLATAEEILTQAEEAFNSKSYALSIELCTKLVDLDPTAVDAYRRRGNAFRLTGEYEKAVADFTRALDAEATPGEIFYRGHAYSKLGDFAKAVADYEWATQVNPRNSAAWENMAEALLIAGQPKRAAAIAEEAISLARAPRHKAVLLMLYLTAESVLDLPLARLSEYEELCEKEFETGWGFEELDDWLQSLGISNETKDTIRRIMDLLRQHRSDNDDDE